MIVTKKIKVIGMSCIGCETIIENCINKIDGVFSVKADHDKAMVKICFNDSVITLDQINVACTDFGYCFENSYDTKTKKLIRISLSVLALLGLTLTILFARTYGHRPILPDVTSQTSAVIIFTIGLFTGLHCVGMCGSFVIGYTVKDAVQGRSIIHSHLLYGFGKTLSYGMFGALFGFFGSIFRITPLVSGISIGIAGVFLVLYGLKMLNVFALLKIIRVKFPSILNRVVLEKRNHSRNPFFIGFLTGLIFGCGPLQAMYVMVAGYGSALVGAKVLVLFGLGTLPALLGFGAFTRLLSSAMTRRFIQISGVILIVLGFIMLSNGYKRIEPQDDFQTVHSCCEGERVG